MRQRLLPFLLISALLIGVAGASATTTAQDVPATLSSSPAPEIPSPQFQLVPVGDYPNGYFDDIEIVPEQSVDLTVAVENTGDIPVELRISPVDAINSINGGFATGDEFAAPTGQSTWLDFPEQVVELEPGAGQELTFTVTVPEGTAPGQYITALVARTVDPIATPGLAAINHTLGYAMSVGILVPGEITHTFDLGMPSIERRGENAVLQVPVTNTGNYLVRPSGQIELLDADGTAIMSSPIAMESVYAGLTTSMEVVLPGQMPVGTYVLNLSLIDEASGATASIEAVEIEVPEAVDPNGVSITDANIEPNAADIAFANIDLVLNNGGQEIPASNVKLDVLHNGDLVESFPLATNQVLLNGENPITARYIPENTWESGTYTFRVVVSAVDPSGGQETILLTDDLNATITVP